MSDPQELDQTIEPAVVEAPEATDADELVQELLPKLSEEDEKKLAFEVESDHINAISDREEWENRLSEWEDSYHNRLPSKTFPWVGSANFHVPLTMMGVETYKPRLVEGVLGQTPPVIVVPSKGTDDVRLDKVERFLNWQVLTELPLDQLVPESAHLFLQPGLVIAKTYWRVKRTTRRMVREFPRDTQLPEIFESLFGDQAPEGLKSDGELAWTGTLAASPQGGPALDVSLKMKFLNDTIQVLVVRDEVVETPWVDLIEPTDFVVPANGGSNVQELPWCHQRLWLNESELRTRVKLGRFDAQTVEDLLNKTGGATNPESADAYHTGRAEAEGVSLEGPSDVRATQYEIFEDYRRWDVNNDDEDEEIIVWVAADLPGRVLGWDYLDNVYAHGRRPFRVGRFLPIPFKFYGLSFAEMVKGIQDEINTIHNQKVDFGTLSNVPFYFYRASATFPPITTKIKPGSAIPIDNPQTDILFPQWRTNPAFEAGDEAVLHQYFERLSGLTDLSFGRQPNRVGATRTARGTQTLLSEAGLRFKIVLQEFQRFWTGVFSDILALDQEYLPPQKEFRVTGRLPTVMRIKDRMEIRGQYDLRLATTADQLNKEQMRTDATVLLQAMMNPVAIQAGFVGMKGLRRVYSDLFRSFGKDPDFYLEDQAPIRSPEEELMLMVSGQYVPPTMGENVQMHLQVHQGQMVDPSVPVAVRRLMARHVQETLQIARVQQASQAMGPGGRGQGGTGLVSQSQAGNADIGRAAPQPPALSPAPPGGQPGYGQ